MLSSIMRKDTIGKDPQFSAARLSEKQYRRLTADLGLVNTGQIIKDKIEKELKAEATTKPMFELNYSPKPSVCSDESTVRGFGQIDRTPSK